MFFITSFFPSIFWFWHSCLSEWKHPTVTSYSRKPQLPPSDFAPFCRMNRYMERFSFPHTQPFAAVRQIACRIRTYGITLVRLHAFPFLQDKGGFILHDAVKRFVALSRASQMRVKALAAYLFILPSPASARVNAR